jgi:hypothetical protein
MHPTHLEFVSCGSEKLAIWYDRVFAMLVKLDRNVRDDALSQHYLAYGMTFEEDGETNDEIMDNRFRLFWEVFKEGNRACNFEQVATFGLLCGALGRMHRKSSVESLRGVIDMHKSYIDSLKQLLASEELPASGLISDIREATEKILYLYDEIDSFARGYVQFCEQVVQPLLAPAYPGSEEP